MLESAARLQRLASERYTVGAGSIIELADADLAWVSAAADRVQAEAQLAVARAALLRAQGADA